ERSIVLDYLERQYSNDIVQKYIEYFDQQIVYYHPELMYLSDAGAINQTNSNDSNISTLCNQINAELDQEQRLIVIIYLLDFIKSGTESTFTELRLVNKIASSLNLKYDEFKDIQSFTFDKLNKVIHKDHLLYIDALQSSTDPVIKHMSVEKMDGQIVVLLIQS